MTQAIESRTPGALQEPVDLAAVRLRVELRSDGTSTLWVELPEGGSRREFPQAACADAVASIALIASMLLEADASERVATTRSVMDYVEPTAATGPASAPTPKAEPAPATPPSAKPLTPVPAPRGTAQPAPSPPTTARLRVALSAGALLESAVASGAPLGGDVGLAAWLEPPRPSLWVPSIRAEALATLPVSESATPAEGEVRLRLLAARVHLCPLSVPVGSTLHLVSCLTGDLGNLYARGAGQTLKPQTRTMPWRALGATVRAQLSLGPVVAVDSWLGLRGLTRADRFVFGSEILAYQVPHWSLGAGLGVSVALP